MNKIHLKLWIIIPLLLTGFLLYSRYKTQKRIEENAQMEVLGVEEQNIKEDEIVIEETPKEEITDSGEYEVGIPYYWKSGINVEEEDPLKGYIPNIKSFRNYYETKNSILLGISERETKQILKESIILEEGNYIFSNGIRNTSEYFKWDSESCTEFFYIDVASDVFICDNWVNWLGEPLKEKTYVLTRCNINDKSGYCIFEDYLKEYYNLKTTGETRCFDSDDTEYICEYSEYKNLVEFN
jgi:hypothetical protein